MSLDWTDQVTIFNRTATPLEVKADGKTVVLPPLSEVRVPRFVADLACRQHPVMGTEDPYNPRSFDMLVGVKEWGHDVTPIEQSDAVERLARDELLDPDAKKAVKVQGRVHRGSRMVDRAGFSDDAMFRH